MRAADASGCARCTVGLRRPHLAPWDAAPALWHLGALPPVARHATSQAPHPQHSPEPAAAAARLSPPSGLDASRPWIKPYAATPPAAQPSPAADAKRKRPFIYVYDLLPACLSACQPASLPACQPASLPACQPASLPACQPASLPACRPASLPACPLSPGGAWCTAGMTCPRPTPAACCSTGWARTAAPGGWVGGACLSERAAPQEGTAPIASWTAAARAGRARGGGGSVC
jgi:hypothetical protein